MPAEPDYYEILQVAPHADPEVIQAAYQRLAGKYHPDVNNSPDATKRTKDIGEAFGVLNDPVRRADYDRRRFPPKQGQQQFKSGASTEESTSIDSEPAPQGSQDSFYTTCAVIAMFVGCSWTLVVVVVLIWGLLKLH